MKRDGFTLIEVLVAMSILALAVMILSNGVLSNLRAERETRAAAAARAYAQNALELFRNVWSDPVKYKAGVKPDFSGLPALPAEYLKKAPDLNATPVTLKDSTGNDITTTKDGVVQVYQVDVIVYKGTTPAVRMSTRISDPSTRTRIK